MARRWTLRLVLVATAVLVLAAGTSVYHGDPVPGPDTSVNRTFVQVWWFVFRTGARPSTASNIVITVALIGVVGLLTGLIALLVTRRRRRSIS